MSLTPRRVRIALRGLAFVLVLLFAGCPESLTNTEYVLTLAPVEADLFVGDSIRFTATLRDDAGNDVDEPFTWTVANPAIATVDAGGTVRGRAAGGTQLAVSAKGLTRTAPVTVQVDGGHEITIAPPAASVFVDATVHFAATVRDRNGDTLDVDPVWSSSDPGVVSVNGAGRARGVSPGTAQVRATAGTLAAAAAITVMARPATAVLVGAGDIAMCNSSDDERTAALLDDIPGTVFTAGDNAYPDGTAAEFAGCYDPSWGRHKARTRPAAGNHEYFSPQAAPYFDYFGAAAGEPGRGYYSYDLGMWHVIVLNSNLSLQAGSPQEQWLRADLADNSTRCTLAYWHHPRFSSGRHGNNTLLVDAWRALYEADADLVLVGHDHTYERFAPQTPDGELDMSRGIRQIIVGTGGAGLYEFRTIAANSEVRGNETKGVLKLTLHRDRYDWEFVPVDGGDLDDSGSSSCH